MTEPLLPLTLLPPLLLLILSFMNCMCPPPYTVFHALVPLLMPFLLFRMLFFFLASLAILFSRKFSLASAHCICASPTNWPSLFFLCLLEIEMMFICVVFTDTCSLPSPLLPSILSNLKAGAILSHLLSFQCLTSARSGCWRTKLIALSHSFAHFITQMSCLSRNLCGSSQALVSTMASQDVGHGLFFM